MRMFALIPLKYFFKFKNNRFKLILNIYYQYQITNEKED